MPPGADPDIVAKGGYVRPDHVEKRLIFVDDKRSDRLVGPVIDELAQTDAGFDLSSADFGCSHGQRSAEGVAIERISERVADTIADGCAAGRVGRKAADEKERGNAHAGRIRQRFPVSGPAAASPDTRQVRQGRQRVGPGPVAVAGRRRWHSPAHKIPLDTLDRGLERCASALTSVFDSVGSLIRSRSTKVLRARSYSAWRCSLVFGLSDPTARASQG